jgi:SAM-dependent methyltransferase
LTRRRAAVSRRFPFIIRLKAGEPSEEPELVRLKLDPGSQTTGVALVNDASGQVVWAADLTQRGQQVTARLDQRRRCRRSRRQRHTRSRPPRFLNRRRRAGWLPPSGASRRSNTLTWVARLRRWCPLGALSLEFVTVRAAPHHYPDLRAAAHEMARVLRPEGRLVVIDSVAAADPELDAFDNEIERRRDPTHVRNSTEQEWRDLLQAAGLAVTHAEQQRVTVDFAPWTARSGMPAEACESLERDMLAAPPAIRAYFAITEQEGHVASWGLDLLVLRATKPEE